MFVCCTCVTPLFPCIGGGGVIDTAFISRLFGKLVEDGQLQYHLLYGRIRAALAFMLQLQLSTPWCSSPCCLRHPSSHYAKQKGTTHNIVYLPEYDIQPPSHPISPHCMFLHRGLSNRPGIDRNRSYVIASQMQDTFSLSNQRCRRSVRYVTRCVCRTRASCNHDPIYQRTT
jgi:hypothetical protein